MLPALIGALGAAKGGGGMGLTDSSSVSQTISGNTFGGVNLGTMANKHETPDFIASRLTGKPQASTMLNDPLVLVVGLSVVSIIGALIIRRLT
jgi:hypothetical protein